MSLTDLGERVPAGEPGDLPPASPAEIGLGEGHITDRRALAVIALDTALFAVASFAVVFSPWLRNLVTDPRRRHFYAAQSYLLVGIDCSALAILAAFEALGMLQ